MNQAPQSIGISLVETIRGDILSARLAPNTKLTVKMLSDLYDCGASPVREALTSLTSEGLVQRIDRRGFFVSGISAEEFADILRNRCLMEGEALRLSITQGGNDWEERVLISHFRLANLDKEVAGTTGTRPNVAWEAAHKNFHMALISACQSRILTDVCERLHELNNRYRFFARTVQGATRSLDAEHTALRDLALARQGDDAVTALLDHYQKTGEAIMKAASEPPEHRDALYRTRPDEYIKQEAYG
jgi:DNA-binding GntR family transcriptional regulator